MGLLLLFAFISIGFSFLCSVWESVLLSITPSFVEVQKEKGGTVGRLIQKFKANIDQPLAAILTLNTIAHTAGAIGVGAVAGKIYGDEPMMIGGVEMPFSPEALIGVIMTLAILIVSEIIPKTIGANFWKQLTPFTVQGVNFIIYALYPLVWVSQFITKRLKKDKGRSIFTKAEFSALADLGARQGLYREGESMIIKNLMKLQELRSADIMTPRTVVMSAPGNQTIKDFYDHHNDLRFSRIPIYHDKPDHVNAYVLKDELLDSIIQGNGGQPLSSIAREMQIVPSTINITDLFDRLMEAREHIALVVDEFGGMAGIVTQEDVVETILGMEIVDEMDDTHDMQALARQNWERRARQRGLIDLIEEIEEQRKEE